MAIVSFILIVVLSGDAPVQDHNSNWRDSRLTLHGVRKGGNLKFSLKSSSNNNEVVYTTGKRLFYLEYPNSVEEIRLEDVLQIDVEVLVTERNRQKIVALTTTFNNIQSINAVILKIITDSNIYQIGLDRNREAIDKANQFKLTVERDLKTLNQPETISLKKTES